MSEVIINGKKFQGKNIVVIGGKVLIDGQSAISDKQTEINIIVHGDVNSIKADHCNNITVSGNAGEVRTQSGDVNVTGNVLGSIECTSGDIVCGDVAGNVSTTSGDAVCGDVAGSVSTKSGDIEHR